MQWQSCMKHSLKFATFLSCYDIRNFGVLQRFCHEKNSILARNLCWKDKRICIPQHTMFPTLNLPSCLLSETIEIVLSLTSAYMDKNTRFIQEKYQNFHNSHERNIAPNNHVTILLWITFKGLPLYLNVLYSLLFYSILLWILFYDFANI